MFYFTDIVIIWECSPNDLYFVNILNQIGNLHLMVELKIFRYGTEYCLKWSIEEGKLKSGENIVQVEQVLLLSAVFVVEKHQNSKHYLCKKDSL